MASSFSSYNHRKLLIIPNNTNITNPTVQTCLYFCNTLKNDTVSSSSPTTTTGFCPPACLEICPSTCHHSLSSILPIYIPPSHPNTPHNLSPLLISMLILLASVFLLITFYVLYSKLYSQTRPNNNNNNSSSDDSVDEEQGRPTMVFHPIWYIPTVGLNPTVISSIKVYKYEEAGMMEGRDCAVCLGEFVVGDDLRVLPKCNHVFHIHCIDTWLMSHVTCPLCRAAIVTTTSTSNDRDTTTTTTVDDESIITTEDNNRNNNVEECLEEDDKEGKLGRSSTSSSQRWSLERGAACLVSRSLSCSGKIFSSRYNNSNRPSPDS